MSAPAIPSMLATSRDEDLASAPPASVVRALPVYVAAAAGAEALVAFGDALAGALVEAALILVILNHYALVVRAADGERWTWRLATLPVLALLPLLRLVSLSLPLTELPRTYWPLAVGLPVLTAAILVVRALGLRPGEIGLRLSSLQWQTAIVLAAIPLGLVAYHLLDPAPLRGSTTDVALQVGILVVFAAVTEELVFRGLVQRAFDGVLGLPGVVWSTCLFAFVYMGSQSAELVAFMVGVGLLFGLVVHRTGSIVGVVVAHALLLVALLVVWPEVLPRDEVAAAVAPSRALPDQPASMLVPMRPQPTVRLVYSRTKTGSSISQLSVAAPPGAVVRIGCDGRGCPGAGVVARSAAFVPRRFSSLEGRLAGGARISIVIAQPGRIDRKVSYLIRRGRSPLARGGGTSSTR